MFVALPAWGAFDYDFYFGKSFDNTSKSVLSLGLVTTLGVHPYDEDVRGQWRSNQKMNKDVTHSGDLLGSGVPGALIAFGQYYWDRENGINHLRALVGSGVYTSVLKVGVNRQRPSNSTNRLSFPSGHTSSAFATATSLYMSYGYKVGVPAYLLASLVATSRLSSDVHFLSDVVGGATIGIWMGYAYSQKISQLKTSDSRNLNSKNANFQILPSVQNEAYFVNVLSQF